MVSIAVHFERQRRQYRLVLRDDTPLPLVFADALVVEVAAFNGFGVECWQRVDHGRARDLVGDIARPLWAACFALYGGRTPPYNDLAVIDGDSSDAVVVHLGELEIPRTLTISEEEISMVLSLYANGYRLCCPGFDGYIDPCDVVGPQRARVLSEWVYDKLGCRQVEIEPDYYFEQLVGWFAMKLDMEIV